MSVSPQEITGVDRVKWDQFYHSHFDFRQGEHITLIGPTGVGKTTLAVNAIEKRQFVVVFATKPRDPLLSELKKKGYYTIREWPPPEPRENFPKVLLWPPVEKVQDLKQQKRIFGNALESIYAQGGWAVLLDELRYITDYLKLQSLVELLWQQGRSLDVSLLSNTQRPRFVPLNAYSQATHLFIWRTPDESDLRRVGEAGSIPYDILDSARYLDKHSFLYVNIREQYAVISKVE